MFLLLASLAPGSLSHYLHLTKHSWTNVSSYHQPRENSLLFKADKQIGVLEGKGHQNGALG